MSYVYPHHIISFLPKALRIFSSKSAINKLPYGGVSFVPIAVSLACLKVFSSNSKMLFFQHNFSKFCKGVTFDLFVISQFQKSSKRSQTFTMGNVRIKTNNVNSTHNRSLC